MKIGDIFLTFHNTETSLKLSLKLNSIPIKAKVVFLCLSTMLKKRDSGCFCWWSFLFRNRTDRRRSEVILLWFCARLIVLFLQSLVPQLIITIYVLLWCVCLLGAYRCRFMMYGIILNLSVASPLYVLGVQLWPHGRPEKTVFNEYFINTFGKVSHYTLFQCF